MDNFTIKIEDSNDIDERILLDIEKQEVENKNIAINFNFTKSEGASNEEPPKKEESNDEDVNRSFETIFLPEVYEGVAMETPFFDINKYKKICGLPTEDYEITHTGSDDISVNNSENVHLRTESSQMNSEDVGFHSPIFSSFPSQNSNFRQMPECNSRIPINNLHVNYNNLYQPERYMNAHPEKNIPQWDSEFIEDSRNSSICSPPYRNKRETPEDDDVIIIEDSEVVDHSENSDTQFSDKFGPISNVKKPHRTYNNESTQFIKGIPKADEAKYTCPICKRPRMFYTLTAVNNHLKFEHISVLRNNAGKPRDSISPENSQVDKLYTT